MHYVPVYRFRPGIQGWELPNILGNFPNFHGKCAQKMHVIAHLQYILRNGRKKGSNPYLANRWKHAQCTLPCITACYVTYNILLCLTLCILILLSGLGLEWEG